MNRAIDPYSDALVFNLSGVVGPPVAPSCRRQATRTGAGDPVFLICRPARVDVGYPRFEEPA